MIFYVGIAQAWGAQGEREYALRPRSFALQLEGCVCDAARETRPGREGRGARAKSDTSACLAFNVVQLGAARAEQLRSEVGRGGDSIVQGNRDMCS